MSPAQSSIRKIPMIKFMRITLHKSSNNQSNCNWRNSEVAKNSNENNIGIAVRTGGHQYSGASSTSGRNIQLDLSGSFDSIAKDFRYNYSTNLLWIGISFSVFEFQSYSRFNEIDVDGNHLQTPLAWIVCLIPNVI